MTAGFWNGKRVLVTGHTGFKGAWLTLWLSSVQAEVTGYALAPPTQPSFFELVDVAALCRSLHGDVRDLDHLGRVVREGRFDAIFHLAAQALVRPSYRDPIETYSTNVLGTANVLEAVRQSGGSPAVVIVTSDKCYENREQPAGYVETDPMGGHDPYSSSKGCAELVTAAFRRSYFTEGPTAVASARAGNVIGGGDWAQDRLLPDCVRSFAEGRAVAIRNPQATRPWQHVLEPLGGYLLLAERLTKDGRAFAEAWNFGPDEKDVCPVWQVAQRFAELWGRLVGLELPQGPRTIELASANEHRPGPDLDGPVVPGRSRRGRRSGAGAAADRTIHGKESVGLCPRADSVKPS
jgi:CDP-glucose 4,6-dehydratase